MKKSRPPSGNIVGNNLKISWKLTGVGIILDNLAKDNKDNAKFYLYLYLR